MSGEMLAGQDTPAAQPSEAQTLSPEQQTGNPEPQTDGGEGDKESPAPKTFTQAELDAIVAREKAKAERKAFREALNKVTSQPKPEPKREAFADDEAFSKAQLEHLAEQRAEQKLREREAQKEAERRQEAFIEKAEKAAERYPDFQTVVSNPNLPINEAMAEYIAESDLGADLAYHLGKHPMQAAQIAQLSPVKAARELARLEAELASKPKATPSRAPDPITPVGSRGAARSSSLPSDDDDIETWMRKERERMSKRG
ncbi:MAG TPA: hypothetical protein VEB23_16350 [Ramlibacter sp.]|nr:hypothetical protein [Ramlibacter sp.]